MNNSKFETRLLELLTSIDEKLNILTSSPAIGNTNVGRSLGWDELKPGDLITFDKVRSKYLTVDKNYKVIHVDKDWKTKYWSFFSVLDDNNKRKSLRKFAGGYEMRSV